MGAFYTGAGFTVEAMSSALVEVGVGAHWDFKPSLDGDEPTSGGLDEESILAEEEPVFLKFLKGGLDPAFLRECGADIRPYLSQE